MACKGYLALALYRAKLFQTFKLVSNGPSLLKYVYCIRPGSSTLTEEQKAGLVPRVKVDGSHRWANYTAHVLCVHHMKGPLAKRLHLRDASFAGLAEVGSEHVVRAIMGRMNSNDPVAAQIRSETDGGSQVAVLSDHELFLLSLARETAAVEARQLQHKAVELAALEIAHAERRAIASTKVVESRAALETKAAEAQMEAQTQAVVAECAARKRKAKTDGDADAAKSRRMVAEEKVLTRRIKHDGAAEAGPSRSSRGSSRAGRDPYYFTPQVDRKPTGTNLSSNAQTLPSRLAQTLP